MTKINNTTDTGIKHEDYFLAGWETSRQIDGYYGNQQLAKKVLARWEAKEDSEEKKAFLQGYQKAMLD
jgi:hypothetical protein